MPDGLGTDDPHDRAMGKRPGGVPTGSSGPGSSGPTGTNPLIQRLAALEDWLLGAEHHAGCSGEYKKDDGTWAYRCKCGLRELRDER